MDAATTYGILAVDSLNPNNYNLFDEKTTFNMLAHAADMLAIMFGHLDILELLKEEKK